MRSVRQFGSELRGYVLIVIAMLIWGSVGIFARFTSVPAPVIVFYRVITAFIIMGVSWVVQGWKGREQPNLLP